MKSIESLFVGGVVIEIAESVGDAVDVVSVVAFPTGSREMVEWGTSGRFESVVGIRPTFNCKALYASL